MTSDSPGRREAGAPDDDPHPVRVTPFTHLVPDTAIGGDRR
ncbi:hypothetical protein [Brevibacterium atlanticum]|nr:hypothetical protein [Brevibacterium atlanticum]